MPDTSAGADDVRASRCGPLRASSLVGTVSSGQNLVVARPSDLEMHKGERLSRARGFPGAQSEKQVNTVPLPICVSSHAKASFERENGGFSVEKTTATSRQPEAFCGLFPSHPRNGNITRAIFCHDDRQTDDLLLFPSRTISQHFNECASTRRRLSARRVHIHTATSTTLNRFNNRKAQQRTNFNSSNSATERSANNPTGDSLSSARRDKSAFVAPRAARFKNKHCQRKRKSLLFRRRTLIVFSPSSTWARTRPRRSRSPP